MPTAARLFAAISLAIVAFVASGMIPPLFPEGTDFGYFRPLNTVIGVIVGWTTVGGRAGRGMTSAITIGLTGAIVLVFWALFAQSCNEMVKLALRNRYGNAFEAIIAIFEIGSEWLILMATVPILGFLALGGIASGIMAEFAFKRWK